MRWMLLKNKLKLSVYLVGFGVSTTVGAAGTILPSFDEFNRSVNAGSEIGLGIFYEKQKVDSLLHGIEPAGDSDWETHSTLTTGLFPLSTGTTLTVSYKVRSAHRDGLGSTLWTEVRYFNKQGVNIDKANGYSEAAPADWSQRTIVLSPQKPGVAYAEIWFVKYENAKNDVDIEAKEERAEREKEEGKQIYKKEIGIYIADIKVQ